MNSVRIIGGKSLKGEVVPQGAKNEALQVLCAVLLTDDKITINNIPDIIDVNKLIEILKNLGVSCSSLNNGSYEFSASAINCAALINSMYLEHTSKAIYSASLINNKRSDSASKLSRLASADALNPLNRS